MKNKYLEEVINQQKAVESGLSKSRRQRIMPQENVVAYEAEESLNEDMRQAAPLDYSAISVPDYPYHEAHSGLDIKITGRWHFKTVIIPPNAYVVHTRRGHSKPLHIGMGLSFKYNPNKDAFFVVPATIQTILISAPCICKEKQGILVQGYMQWIIEDFEKAYTKLDFSDPGDPMRIVNIQLKEQAEAAIKDTVATMGIDEVLSDKQPIIKELTRRLRELSEGDGDQEGLGLGIVTVQIKEAVVSSANLWEMLQRPFRADRAKEARLSELENEALVKEREEKARRQANQLEVETRKINYELNAQTEASEFDYQSKEAMRRTQMEAKHLEEKMAAEKIKLQQEAELRTMKQKADRDYQEQESILKRKILEREVDISKQRQSVANDISHAHLQRLLIERLPEIMAKLPNPTEQHSISLFSENQFKNIIEGIMQLIEKIKGNKDQD